MSVSYENLCLIIVSTYILIWYMPCILSTDLGAKITPPITGGLVVLPGGLLRWSDLFYDKLTSRDRVEII